MTKDKWLYTILAVLFVGYAAVEHYAPEPLQWIPTYAPDDKQPYGGYILYEQLDDFFSDKEKTYNTLYEQTDSLANYLILCDKFTPANGDLKEIFSILEAGGHILIGARFFDDDFLDTLGLSSETNLAQMTFEAGDSIAVRIEDELIYFPSSMVLSSLFFDDSTLWQTRAYSQGGILVSKSFGKGVLALSTFPLGFTNYSILRSKGYLFSETALNLLHPGKVIYNRYYMMGRGESSSPLRFLISQPALRWALYLSTFMVVLILIVNSRRKQRAIPLKDPKTNTTVAFIKTIGALYFGEGNHAGAAERLITHFLQTLTKKYFIKDFFNEESYKTLSAKFGIPVEEVIKTFELIQYIRNGGRVSEELLARLNQHIARFKV